MNGRADFISRFLYHLAGDEFYWASGTPPPREVIDLAANTAKDLIDWDDHKEAFTTLADVIDVCTTEELESKGNGQAARNATKHPRVVALTNLEPERRAALALAALQGLAWMEDCRQWVQDHTLRNQIAKRVMTAVALSVGRLKKGYTAQQIGALVRIGACLNDSDGFVLRSRGMVAEILAGNLTIIPLDDETLQVLRRFLDRIASQPNAAPVFKALDKLSTLTSEEHAPQLRNKSAQWR